MKTEFVYGIIKSAVFLLIGFSLLYIMWSMRNVVLTLTGDGMRVVVVVAAYALSVPLYLQYALFAVRKKDHWMLYLSAGAGLIALAIGGAFVLVDYSMNMFNTFDAIDTRLRSAISAAIWIVCAVLLACTFGLAILFKKWYPKTSVPHGVVIGEIAASAFCIWGNAWGTSDAVYTLTQDTFSSVGMAITLDFLIFIAGAWYIAANDSSTEKLTLIIASVGLVVTSVMQMLDGYLRGGGVQVEGEMKNLAQFGFPFILFGSVVALIATALVDYWNGGFSFVKESKDSGGQHYVKRDNPEIRVSRPERPMRPPQVTAESGHGSAHGKQDFAEPGGLPEPLVARLKSIGYSGNAIRKMNLAEAREAARKPLVMAGDMPSKNGTEPKEPTGENFN